MLFGSQRNDSLAGNAGLTSFLNAKDDKMIVEYREEDEDEINKKLKSRPLAPIKMVLPPAAQKSSFGMGFSMKQPTFGLE